MKCVFPKRRTVSKPHDVTTQMTELFSPVCPLSSCRADAPADCQTLWCLASSGPHCLHSDPRGRPLSCRQQTQLFRWLQWMSRGSASTFLQQLIFIQHCCCTPLQAGRWLPTFRSVVPPQFLLYWRWRQNTPPKWSHLTTKVQSVVTRDRIFMP
jgi:hypothetical protein